MMHDILHDFPLLFSPMFTSLPPTTSSSSVPTSFSLVSPSSSSSSSSSSLHLLPALRTSTVVPSLQPILIIPCHHAITTTYNCSPKIYMHICVCVYVYIYIYPSHNTSTHPLIFKNRFHSIYIYT